MHEYTMNVIGKYIEDNYNPETMTCDQLKELSSLADIFKDILTGDYYYTIIEAMHNNADDENMEYIEKYIPETTRYYTPTNEKFRKRMYYTELDDAMYGKSYKSRKKYMEDVESKSDDTSITHDIDIYISDLKSDISEMLTNMSNACKQNLKQNLVNMASKIV